MGRIRLLVAATLCALAFGVRAQIYNTSTGTFAVASLARDWSNFNWEWSGRDYQRISVTFSGLTTPAAFSNVYFRLAYPEKGPYYLEISSGVLTPAASSLAWAMSSALNPTNIPPDNIYFAELYGVGASGSKTFAKGRVRVNYSLFSNTNGASWTPISITYSATGGVTIAETDPIWGAVSNAVRAGAALGATSIQPTTAAYTNAVALAGSAVQTEADPIWAAVSNAVRAGAALGATSIQPTTAAYTNAVALAGSAVQTEADPIWAAVSNAVRAGAALGATAVQTEADPIWAAVSNTVRAGAALGATAVQTEADPIWAAVSNTIVTRAANGQTAYGWGNHASAGYLSATETRYDSLDVGYLTELSTNLCDLTGTYTGVVTSVAFTGDVTIVAGRLYAWGFTKQNAYGTSVFTVAGQTLTATASGAASNYFAATQSDSNAVLTLYGDGSAKSDVSSVYIMQMTNGLVTAVKLQAQYAEIEDATIDALTIPTGAVSGKVWKCTATSGAGEWDTAGAGDMTEAEYATNGAAGKVDYAIYADDSGDSMTNAVAAAGTSNNVVYSGRVLTVTFAPAVALYRTTIATNSNEEITVLATTTNITAIRASTTITVTIPSGEVLQSISGRWPANTLGTSFTLAFSGGDLGEATSYADRVRGTFTAWLESSNAPVPSGQLRLDGTNYTQVRVVALNDSGVNSWHISF